MNHPKFQSPITQITFPIFPAYHTYHQFDLVDTFPKFHEQFHSGGVTPKTWGTAIILWSSFTTIIVILFILWQISSSQIWLVSSNFKIKTNIINIYKYCFLVKPNQFLVMSAMSKPYLGPQHFSGPVLNKQPPVLGNQRKITTLKDQDKQINSYKNTRQRWKFQNNA